MKWTNIQISILAFLGLILVLQLPATLYVDNSFVLDFMSYARLFQLSMVVFFVFAVFKFPRFNFLNIFLLFSILIQVVATIKFESHKELAAYNFIPILIFISAITFRKGINEWLRVNFPISIGSLILPIFFKDKVLYSSFSFVINNFLFSMFSLFVSVAIVLLYSTREYYSRKLREELENQETRLHIEFEEIKQLRIQLEIGKIASQVAHDIRSPLAALDTVTGSLQSIPPTEQKIIKNAIQRINDIANDLLNQNKNKKSANMESVQIHDLISNIVTEKNILLEKKKMNLILLETSELNSVTVKIYQQELMRAMSNLINNSIEAISKETGLIKIITKNDNEIVKIIIRDNGKGIPKDIISKLGEIGSTFGKTDSAESGTGLGLYQVKQALEQIGGSLEIQSEENKGTDVILSIPFEKKDIAHNCYLIDDDALVRMTWEMKAKKAGVSLKTFESPAAFILIKNEISKDSTIYIDSELGEIKGEVIAEELFKEGFTNISLTTGYPAEKFKELSFLKSVISKQAPF